MESIRNPIGAEELIFSIIVPTYERPGQLAVCLQALARLDFPRERFEVIVVDDGSKMPPEAVLAPFHDRLQVTLLLQPHAGPAAARNIGAMRARGKFLAFTDDDCAPTPDWLQVLTARFAQVPDQIIGGQTINALPDNPYSTACQLLMDYLYRCYNTEPSHARFFASNNLALPADRFRAMGGFDTSFPLAAGEDRELCDRWLHTGYRMTYAPEALIYHTHALTFLTFCRQQFNYGRGALCFHQARAQRDRKRIRLESFSFYRNLVCHPLSQAQGERALMLEALLVVSQIAIATGFLWERFNRTNWRSSGQETPLICQTTPSGADVEKSETK